MERKMRSLISLSMLSVLLVGVTMTPAHAGLGDVGKFMRDKNAICEQQRRGELPPHPSQCLPELPPGPVYQDQQRR
jgi:hypothetical protein